MKITIVPLERTEAGTIEKLEPLTAEAKSARVLAAEMVAQGLREARLVEETGIAPERIRIAHGHILIT